MKHICPVCGYNDLSEPAYYEDSEPSYEICLSCDFQYGNTDDDKGFTHEEWRKNWITDGMKWNWGKENPPPNWNPKKQLENIGIFIKWVFLIAKIILKKFIVWLCDFLLNIVSDFTKLALKAYIRVYKYIREVRFCYKFTNYLPFLLVENIFFT